MSSTSTKFWTTIIISCQVWILLIVLAVFQQWDYFMKIVWILPGIWTGYTGFKFVQNLAYLGVNGNGNGVGGSKAVAMSKTNQGGE